MVYPSSAVSCGINCVCTTLKFQLILHVECVARDPKSMSFDVFVNGATFALRDIVCCCMRGFSLVGDSSDAVYCVFEGWNLGRGCVRCMLKH